MVLDSFKYGKISPLSKPSKPSSDSLSDIHLTYKNVISSHE